MARKYQFVTKKIPTAYGPGKTAITLVWQDITALTRDPTIRRAMPGEYAVVDDLDLVYIHAHNKPAKGAR